IDRIVSVYCIRHTIATTIWIYWTQWSRRKKGLCGIVNCYNKRTTKCKKCTNYYCHEHFPSHLDLLSDADFDYSSSNEGLEWFMDDEHVDFNSDETTDD
ncbi:MAG: hypothetical protein ACRD5J_18295, partial [Nitrososphaeraceae archaeon]